MCMCVKESECVRVRESDYKYVLSKGRGGIIRDELREWRNGHNNNNNNNKSET